MRRSTASSPDARTPRRIFRRGFRPSNGCEADMGVAATRQKKKKSGRRAEPASNGDAPPEKEAAPIRTLAVDIGGTGIKMVVLNELGHPVTERVRVKTPDDATPGAVLDAIAD